MPETSIIHFIPYPADTLYILAENQDTVVAQLVDLSKAWRADAVDVCDGISSDEELSLRDYVKVRLQHSL